MWKLYCLPGRLISELGFLFPGRRSGDISATARRRENTFAHFLFATPFWLLAGPYLFAVLLGLFSTVTGYKLPQSVASSPATISNGETQLAESAGSSDAQADQPTPVDPEEQAAQDVMVDRDAGSYSTRNPIAASQSPARTEPAQSKALGDPGLAEITRNPRSVAEVDAAMTATFRSGVAERWRVGKLRGYAVASTASLDGCKMVRVTIDSLDTASIEPLEICPE